MGHRKKRMQDMVTQVNNNSNGKGNILSPAIQTPDYSDTTKYEKIVDGGRGLEGVVKDIETGTHYNPNFGFEVKADTIYSPFKPGEVMDIEWNRVPSSPSTDDKTIPVHQKSSPLAQQMEDDGISWKNESQLTNLTPNPNEIKVKRRKDGSIRKTIEGDRVKWDDEVGKQQIKTKYRRDGSKKKEVIKTVNSEDTGLFKDNERVGYSTTIRKYDKQNKPKTPKFQKTAGRGMWGELSTDKDSTTKQTRTKYRATAKQRLKEGATWAGITAGVVGAEIGAVTLPFVIGEHRMKKGKKVFTETGWDKNY